METFTGISASNRVSLAMVAHDLRNAVQAALLAKDFLDLVVGDPKGREAVTILGHQLRHIGELAGALREVGHPEPNDPDISEEEVAETLLSAAEGRVGVVIEAPRGLRTTCPRADLHRIMANLINNALLHGDAPVRIHARGCGSFVEVTVSDDGPGVAAEFVPKMFEPFTQYPYQSAPGSGLGLAIVRELCERNRGRVEFESGPTPGARFRVQLPMAAGTSSSSLEP